mmetsp:Transcript_4392/g.11145  ORF Transcript_4392/g.11145 Transcript_4392/m.11145 type:complete len:128 (+) Transcript_4392:127-510(+)
MSCPAGFGSAADVVSTQPEVAELRQRVLRRMISCRQFTEDLRKCRQDVAKRGHGSCAHAAKMHSLCVKTQISDRDRIQTACNTPPGGLTQIEYQLGKCQKSGWFWQDCLGPLRELAKCAETTTQRPT